MSHLRTLAFAGACVAAYAATPSVTNAQQLQNHHPISLLNSFRPIGGGGNNLSHPDFNPVPGSPELVLASLNFQPGTRDGLVSGPNPRTVSNVISGGTGANGANDQSEDPRASAWLYVFGQFVDHDLSLESNAPGGTPINITVPPGDPVFPGTTINMTRDLRNARTNTIVTTVAGFLDLSQLYGSTQEQAASLRNADGTLKTSNGGSALQISNNAFVAGDARVNENPELAAVTILFMREHNFWVGELKNQNPGWNGDQLYQMARAITTAEYQNVVYNEFLPVLVGSAVGGYRGYNPNVNPQVFQEFTTSAFRVGHSQVSDEQSGIDNRGNTTFTQSLADAFANTAQQTLQNGIDPLLRSITADGALATDPFVVSVLRNLLFAPLPGGNVDQIDLIAIDVQRERDAGIATLAQTRRALGLPQYGSFADLTPDRNLQNAYRQIYGTVGQVDLFMGGLAERHASGAVVGPTFQAITARQFRNLRDGDRFYWQNQRFDAATASTIASTKLGQIIKRNTDTISQPDNVFVTTTVRPHPGPHRRSATIDLHGRQRPFADD